jgi:hypothetical protein
MFDVECFPNNPRLGKSSQRATMLGDGSAEAVDANSVSGRSVTPIRQNSPHSGLISEFPLLPFSFEPLPFNPRG